MTGEEIVAEARKWLGTRYRIKGRSARGLDCLGLLVMIGRAFGVPHVDEQDYSNWPRADHLILRRLAEFLDTLPIDDARPGTIGVFAEHRLPGHVGVFSELHGEPHIIHARIVPPYVLEESWNAIPRTEIRLIGRFGLPGMEG